jgi:D-lactate dehydrogenase
MISDDTISHMKHGVMLINTSRGALLDTQAVIHGIRQRKIGLLGIDVYENERGIFFENREDDIIDDDGFMRLITFPNVIVTAHQAFFTREAVTNISESVVQSLQEYIHGYKLTNEVLP